MLIDACDVVLWGRNLLQGDMDCIEVACELTRIRSARTSRGRPEVGPVLAYRSSGIRSLCLPLRPARGFYSGFCVRQISGLVGSDLVQKRLCRPEIPGSVEKEVHLSGFEETPATSTVAIRLNRETS